MLGKMKVEKKFLSKDKWHSVTRVFRYIRPYLGYFIFGMIMLALSSVILMVFLFVAGEMANAANGESRFGLPVRDYGWVFLILLVAQAAFSYLRTVSMAIVSENGMADLRKDLFNKIATLPYPYFESKRIGELTSRITNDIEKLQNTFSVTLAEFLRQIITLVIGIAVLAWLAPRLSLIMLASIPVVVLVAMVFGRYIRKISKERQDQMADSNTIAEEVLQNFQIVKSFTNEYVESLRYSRSIKEVVEISIRYAKWRGFFFMFVITLLFGGIFFVLWQGALMVESGDMKLGDLFSFIMYTGMIGGAIAGLGSLTTQLIGAIGATDRVFEILDQEHEIELSKPLKTYPRFNGTVSFADVSFAYPSRPEITVLKDIDIHIESGQTIALVGASGAGKSTLTSLLLRLYDYDRGIISIDGEDVRQIDLTTLRRNMALVPQDISLFAGSIRENILYGRPDASEEEVVDAARNANALDFINEFPDGLDTIVGERGAKVSGGQRQRIAIARALLRDPAILILDEATSSLDAESEQLVQLALDTLMKGRTSIIIAHRLSTVRNVDQIYVLAQGEIVESGTHDELMSNQHGAYNQLARLQLETD
ncbi:ATP-binding cassette domain-containing protein [Membranicola marinus]|uniref:ATP-binding cassette domain-containing protein n=1 Tax=Membranihabitans marinus TaxID=1227546 RepID=A0A953HRV6_9BACT|nr:ABC transporter transmembrane domain-containing protein [Membranihabitans marinus]MBY5957230.1 ATP-binding cassette domain-containing protein [Membranihabitans marinus]